MPVSADGEQSTLQILLQEHRRSLKALRSSEELKQRIIEALPCGMVHVRIDGAIAEANNEAQRILGLSFDDLTQRYTSDFETDTLYESGEPCPVEDYPVTRALMTGKAQPPQTIGIHRPDDSTSWAVFTAVPVLNEDGSVSGAVVTFLDITARKRAEEERLELEQAIQRAGKLESLGVLAGGIAHDFNNLLVGVKASSELLAVELQGNPRHMALLESIHHSARRAEELTHQLLAYSGHGQRESLPLDLSTLSADIANLLHINLPSHVHMKRALASDLPPILADPTQIRQVVMNLLTNAAQSIGPEEGEVLLSTGACPAEPDLSTATVPPPGPVEACVFVEVADTGRGMDAQTISKMFDPFFTTRPQGRGLGLASTLGIVRSHGGFICIESTPGQGTRVRVLFPVRSGSVAK